MRRELFWIWRVGETLSSPTVGTRTTGKTSGMPITDTTSHPHRSPSFISRIFQMQMFRDSTTFTRQTFNFLDTNSSVGTWSWVSLSCDICQRNTLVHRQPIFVHLSIIHAALPGSFHWSVFSNGNYSARQLQDISQNKCVLLSTGLQWTLDLADTDIAENLDLKDTLK